jgi:hypothetical protein
MARPKNNPEAAMPATEREVAPETVVVPAPEPAPYIPPAYVPPAPRQMQVERQGAQSEPFVRRFPQIRGGICEFCGVIDRNYPSQYQYKLCPHYRGMDARCSYCPPSKDPEDVVYHADMNVAESPSNPNTLIMWCNSYECSRAHLARFQKAS